MRRPSIVILDLRLAARAWVRRKRAGRDRRRIERAQVREYLRAAHYREKSER